MRIGLTQGDPHGIGPEICQAALARYGDQLRLFGDPTLTGPDQDLSAAEAGARSAHYVAQAVDAIRSGIIDAIVTAPINKQHWHLAGITAPGHTEYLALCYDANNSPTTRMLFRAPGMRIVLATLHMPLSQIVQSLSVDSIVHTALITHQFLREHEGIASPRLACLGLNPHAGEAGHLGWEEQEIINPALRTLRDQGIEITGPHPADTFFGWQHRHTDTSTHRHNPHDVVIAMYHDQGLIPIKMAYPTQAVNVTLGLPFIRTSVGHGTAQDIAGSGQANPASLFAAIECARELTQQRKSS